MAGREERSDVELDAFIEAHYSRLLRTAYLLTGDRFAAEDLLQEVLARSWAYAQRDRIEQPGAFLRRSLVNRYLNQVRHHRRIREEPTDLAVMPDRRVADASVEVEGRDAVWRTLSVLPPHQRAILVLRFYEDLDEAQIAEVLGVGVGSVRSGTWRGLERLRNALIVEAGDHRD